MIKVIVIYHIGETETKEFMGWREALDYIRSIVDFYWIKKVEIIEI